MTGDVEDTYHKDTVNKQARIFRREKVDGQKLFITSAGGTFEPDAAAKRFNRMVLDARLRGWSDTYVCDDLKVQQNEP